MDQRPLYCTSMVKTFGDVRALDNVDLEVHPGEILGFLGPNGAGKSTAMRAVLGQIRLDGGSAQLYGHDVWNDAVRAHRHVAYVPGDVALWPGLTGGECIDLLAGLQGRPNRERRTDLIERLALDPTKQTRTYSKGNRQKVALIAALSTDADLLLLDEPTSGLDPLMEAQFQAVVRERVEQGAAVLLSSHIMGEVEALCQRVSIIRAGRIVMAASIAELRRRSASTIECTTVEPLGAALRSAGIAVLTEQRGDQGVHTTLRVEPDQLNATVAQILGFGPSALTVQPPSLDEIFLDQYRSDPAEVAMGEAAR